MIWRAKGVENWERERIGRLKWDNTDSCSMLAELMSDARREFPYPTSNSIVSVQTGMSNEKHATHCVISCHFR